MTLKTLLPCITCLLLIACKANQSNVEEIQIKNPIISGCPDGGACTFEIIKESSLELKTDDIGKLYPEVQKGNQDVLKFEYIQDQDPRIADDGYREVIYIEIDSATKTLELNDLDLRKAKVLFGRFCFCGNQAGYFPVKNGNLKVSSNENGTLTYSLNFEMLDLPQQTNNISITK